MRYSSIRTLSRLTPESGYVSLGAHHTPIHFIENIMSQESIVQLTQLQPYVASLLMPSIYPFHHGHWL